MITEIKFAIINLLLHSWEECLACFDCKGRDTFVVSPDVATGYGKSLIYQLAEQVAAELVVVYNTRISSLRNQWF